MYPLPPELSAKIFAILEDGCTDPSCYIRPNQLEYMHDRIAQLLVRENRRIRQQIGELWRNLKETADSDEVDYGDSRAAAGGEFACEHIVNEIIKPNVYFNSTEAQEREENIDKLIQDLFEADDTNLDS
jgi:hypothetical protein